jgi:hypothetical protein
MLLSNNAIVALAAASNSVPGDATPSAPSVSQVGAVSVQNVQAAAAVKSTIGLYSGINASFYLRYSNNAGTADWAFTYNPQFAAWQPIAGNWYGTGVTIVGLYDPATSTFYLKGARATDADRVFAYGPAGAGWKPIVGDWNNDGVETIGLYDPTESRFYLRNTNDSGYADKAFSYGQGGAGWLPITGDWTASGTDTIGLYDPAASRFYLRNTNNAGYADKAFSYGPGGGGWLPMAGDWTASGKDTVGLYDPTTSCYYLRNSNNTGYADNAFLYGPAAAGWQPIVGHWTQSLLVDGSEQPALSVASGLTQQELRPIVTEAIARWSAAGLDAAALAKLGQVQFAIRDLPGATLGEAEVDRVLLDSDAAGYGWFVDSTPRKDDEYAASTVDPRAVDRIDLLTTVEHELGHVLGLGDLDRAAADLMSGWLRPGVRRQPVAADV